MRGGTILISQELEAHVALAILPTLDLYTQHRLDDTRTPPPLDTSTCDFGQTLTLLEQ